MSRFIIEGGRPLSGDICVSGSKNAALPIIFASIAVHGVTTLYNLPNISDVDAALDIVKAFGAKIERFGHSVKIDANDLHYAVPSEELVSKIRASTYLLGAMLVRFGISLVRSFGGCNFGTRPIDMHLDAAGALGAAVDGIEVKADRLCGADIFFDKISVGATVNALIMTAGAVGISRIFGYAKEPHVISLAEFLRKAGAKIEFSERCITVLGTELTSASSYVIPDMIEAGTYACLSMLFGNKIRICGANSSELESFFKPFISSGASFSKSKDYIIPLDKIKDGVDIVTAPYPEFPTDLQPQCAPVLAAYFGGSVTEGVWYNRFEYLNELSKFGIESELRTGCAKILKSNIRPSSAIAPDLRGGAALLLAALYANGESVIENSGLIKRGYADIVDKLSHLGASLYEIK